ncbi:MAG TPA: universal stress protein [Gaiellales bacterium]|jgi:nucleotide-binding universal stress UspA family protein
MSNTIVLALDGTEQSPGPVRYAKEIAHDRDANVVVVHVKELIAGRAAGPLHTDEDVRIASVRSQVADLRAAGIAAELRTSSTLRNPATAIAAAARRAGADLIVVGGTTHGALTGALAGSTPQSLLHTSPCPVLVAPAREVAVAANRDAARTPVAA